MSNKPFHRVEESVLSGVQVPGKRADPCRLCDGELLALPPNLRNGLLGLDPIREGLPTGGVDIAGGVEEAKGEEFPHDVFSWLAIA